MFLEVSKAMYSIIIKFKVSEPFTTLLLLINIKFVWKFSSGKGYMSEFHSL